MEAAGRAEKEFGAEIRAIKKNSPEYAGEKAPLPCPSVVVNGIVVTQNDIVTYEALENALNKY